jgi:methylamine dehydrogenase heavy chain
MRGTIVAGWSAAALFALASGFAAAQPAEQVSVAKLPAATPYRVYLADFAINHVVDGRLYVIDGDALKLEGMIATGFAGLPTLSPDRAELYVATTYYPRLSRGERTDVVDIYDAATLAWKAEVVIPPKHAQALPYRGVIRPSSDGRLLFVQNATPASSVTIVDVKARKFVAEVPTPGCWIILPAATTAGRFSTLCGDGTLLTVTLDAEGKPKSQKKSEKFFDPDADPLFVQAESIGDRYLFLSFRGMVHTANLGGEQASFEAPWSLVAGPDASGGWRPGGYQPLALHEGSGRIFVAMHAKGKDGSHKDPAGEIWAFDLAKKARVARAPGHSAVAIAVSRNAQPRLFAIDGLKMALVVYDADRKLAFKRRMESVAEAGTLLEMH